MNNLSITIITLNEEDNLRDCLISLEGLSDEIVLVDSGSTDKTLEIAREFGVKHYHRDFDNFADQKNFALSKVTCDWVFAIDADERVTPQLGDEVKKVLKGTDCVGFLIPRRNFILGAEIKHSRWSPDKHIWLWKKSFGKWEGNVHEEVVVNGSVGELKNAKLHFQDKTIGEFVKSNEKYSTILAEAMLKQGQSFSIIKMVWDVLFEFGVRFVYHMGFLDGWRGFVLAVLMAKYRLDVWIKLLNLTNRK